MKRTTIGLLSAATVLLAAPFALAEEANSFGEAFTAGKAGAEVRARYEQVDSDGFAENADALTARLRLNFKTAEWRRMTAFAEYDYVFHLVSDFNSGAGTSPDKTGFPVVADPKGADLNQLYLDYAFNEEWQGRLGRQRILLDNQRFVGGVGWRQNEQTYDALTITTRAIPRTDFSYSYVGYVRRIYGETVAAGKDNVDTHLLNARIALNDSWSLTPYFYYIDDQDVAAFSTSTAGVRLTGGVKAGEGKVDIVAEFATQTDSANNPVSYDADYVNLGATWNLANGLSLGLAYESLGGHASQPGASFRTPLATLHAFQGWADMFLATPNEGINDLYATIRYKAGKWNLTGVYHDFSSEAGSGDYGSEFDLSAGTKLTENYGVLFKGAFFSTDSSYPDVTKYWIMFTASY